MSEPEHIGKSKDRIIAIIEQMQPHLNDPAHLARVEAYKRDRLARELREQMEIADLRGIPKDPAVRTIALTAEFRLTSAIKLMKHVFKDRAENEPRVLAVGGGTGCGKSCAGAWAVMNHTKLARFRTAHQCQKIDTEALFADLLVIDEIGTDRDVAPIADILLERWHKGAVTILLGNVTKDFVWDKCFSPPMQSRAAEQQEVKKIYFFYQLRDRDMRRVR